MRKTMSHKLSYLSVSLTFVILMTSCTKSGPTKSGGKEEYIATLDARCEQLKAELRPVQAEAAKMASSPTFNMMKADMRFFEIGDRLNTMRKKVFDELEKISQPQQDLGDLQAFWSECRKYDELYPKFAAAYKAEAELTKASENPDSNQDEAAPSRESNLENAAAQKRSAQSELLLQGGKIDEAARKYGLKVCGSPNTMAE